MSGLEKKYANLHESPERSVRVTEDTVTSFPSYDTLDFPDAMSFEIVVIRVTDWDSLRVNTSYSTIRLPFLYKNWLFKDTDQKHLQ